MKYISLLLLLIMAFVFSSCVGGNKVGSGYKTVKVEFSLNGKDLPSCENTSSTSETNKVFICKWYCADYKGKKPATVFIDFAKDTTTGNWKYFDEVVTFPSRFKCY